MPSIRALSLSPSARAWITDTAQPRVLNLFENACNLVNEHNAVLSVVTQEIGDGPFCLVVSELPDLPWTAHVVVNPEQLVLDDLTIELEGTRTWDPRPDWEKLHASIDAVFSMIAPVEVAAPHLPAALIAEMAAALAADKPSEAARVAGELAGLGPGLTPAGDDFLMGAMHAVWILHPLEVAAALSRAVTEAALPRTTTLSAAWLRAAAAGEASVRWHSLFEAISGGQVDQVSIAIDQIRATGETSGADALCGFVETLRARPTISAKKAR